jgi:hypothetical protein
MSKCPLLLWALAATVRVPRVQQYQQFADVRVPIATVGASNSRACAMCSTAATVR